MRAEKKKPQKSGSQSCRGVYSRVCRGPSILLTRHCACGAKVPFQKSPLFSRALDSPRSLGFSFSSGALSRVSARLFLRASRSLQTRRRASGRGGGSPARKQRGSLCRRAAGFERSSENRLARRSTETAGGRGGGSKTLGNWIFQTFRQIENFVAVFAL